MTDKMRRKLRQRRKMGDTVPVWRICLAVMLLLILVTLAGCGGSSGRKGQDSDSAENADTLRISASSDITIMLNVLEYLSEQLDSNRYRHPLVEDYELDSDNRGVTIRLKEGVLFHNGEEMTAEDVAFSIRLTMEGGYRGLGDFSSNLAYIDPDDLEAEDSYTLHVGFRKVYRFWQEGFSHVPVVSRSAYEACSGDFWSEPVGTGPYKVESWKEDEVLLHSFPDYHEGEPAIHILDFTIMNSSSVAVRELERGNLDVCINVDYTDVDSIREMGDRYIVEASEGLVGDYIGINNASPLLAKEEVRQALACAIDREALLETAIGGNGEVNNGIVGTQDWGYREIDYPWNYDPEKAEELLEKAGVKGKTLVMVVDDSQYRRTMAEQLYDMFDKVGVHLDIHYFTFPDATAILDPENGESTLDWDLYLRGAKYNCGDSIPGILLADPVYRLTNIDAGISEGYEDFQSLLDQLTAETDDAEAEKLFGRLQEKFFSEWMFWIPTITSDYYMAYRSELQGLERYGSTVYWKNVVRTEEGGQ